MKNTTRKISALLVLGLFLVSMVPFASAESDISKLNKAVLEEYANWKEASEKMRNVLKKDMADAQRVINKLKNIPNINHENAAEAREALFPKVSTTVRKLINVGTVDTPLHLIGYGNTVPSAGGTGWSPAALFLHTDGASGDVMQYRNEGSGTSCSFTAITGA